MSEPEHGRISPEDEADMAKAFQELARGEKTAAALEDHLNTLEARIEALLEQANENQRAVEHAKAQESATNQSSGNGDSK